MTKEEAIRRIKAWNLDSDDMEVLATVIPELRESESEDERIRKDLIAFICQFAPEHLKTEYVAYLEKQKEPIQTEEEREYIKTLKGLVSDFIRDAGGDITDVAYYQKICDWLDRRHIEQKPAEWDDYTKTNLDRALQIIKNAKGKLQGYQSDDGIYECDKAIECLEHFLYRGFEIENPAEWSKNDTVFLNEITDYFENKTVRLQHDLDMYAHWLKSLPERFNLQPKQEWSEEDNAMLKVAIAVLRRYSHDDVANWLKSLRPQAKVKWSEEDSGKIWTLSSIIFDYAFYHDALDENNDLTGEYAELDNWLKSLPERCPKKSDNWKPSEQEKGALRTAIHILTDERSFPKAAAHLQNILDAFEGEEPRKEWKPGEEQMDALEHFIRSWGESGTMSPQNPILCAAKSLYNDLKKLM